MTFLAQPESEKRANLLRDELAAPLEPTAPEPRPNFFAGLEPTFANIVSGNPLAGVSRVAARGLAAGAATIATVPYSAARPWAAKLDDLLGTDDTGTRFIDARVQAALRVAKDYSPDPETSGLAAQIVGGFSNIGGRAIAGSVLGGPAGAAALAGASEFTYQRESRLAQGVDDVTASVSALGDAAFMAAGVASPAAFGAAKIANTLVYGPAANVAFGMAQRGYLSTYLASKGYDKLADQYRVFDGEAIAVDAVLGGLFGYMGARGEPSPTQVAAAARLLADRRVEVDAQPGIPSRPDVRNAAVNQINEATIALVEGEPPPALRPELQGADAFIPKEGATPKEILAETFRRAGLEDAAREVEALPDDTVLESIRRGQPAADESTIVEALQPQPAVKRIRDLIDRGDVEGAKAEAARLYRQLEERSADRAGKAIADRERGPEWVQERIMRAKRHGELDAANADLALWLLRRNPALANDLAISVPRKDGGGSSGTYNPVERLITLFRGGDELTGVHEILHHAERMLPPHLRSEIRKAWANRIVDLTELAARTGDMEAMERLDDIWKAAMGDPDAIKAVRSAFKNGELAADLYHLYSPSEFWAEKGSDIIRSRAESVGWVAEARQWLRELFEKVKELLRLPNDAAILRGLDAALRGDGSMSGQLLRGGSEVVNKLTDLAGAKAQDEASIVMGATPGRHGWNVDVNPASDNALPPAFQEPHGFRPRVEVLGEAVGRIFKTASFRRLAADIAGVSNLKISQKIGTWLGEMETSFRISGSGLTPENAIRLARLLGFAFDQDAAIAYRPSHNDPEAHPAYFVGASKRLTPARVDALHKAAQSRGLDFEIADDGKSARFLDHAGGGDEYLAKVREIAQEAGLDEPALFRVSSSFEEWGNYGKDDSRGTGKAEWFEDSSGDPSGLFGRMVDSVLVPYARAAASEGYQFDLDRYAERYGLSDAQRELIRDRLYPKSGAALSIAPVMRGEELLTVPDMRFVRGAVERDNVDGKQKVVAHLIKPKAKVTSVLFALQNRAAALGQILWNDFSPRAMKLMADALTADVEYALSTPAGKDAVGWYDRALKEAKKIYREIFPELATNPDFETSFDVVLGVASQGNTVEANAIIAVRIMSLLRAGKSPEQIISLLGETMGKETKAIRTNYAKWEQLVMQSRNGIAGLHDTFNKKLTVSQWNKLLASDRSLYFDGKPLEVSGAAHQMVSGWSVFGPKIGSFINNLHGDYTTLTADLWFTRTWNRTRGDAFAYNSQTDMVKYRTFVDRMTAEFFQDKSLKKSGSKWEEREHGSDVTGMSYEQIDYILADPERVFEFATTLKSMQDKKSSRASSDMRRAANDWVQSREDALAIPEGDVQRSFQQDTIELVQKQVKRRTGKFLEVADIQAILWYLEKQVYEKFGAARVEDRADYSTAAADVVKMYNDHSLWTINREGKEINLLGDELLTQPDRRVAVDSLGSTTRMAAVEAAKDNKTRSAETAKGVDAAVNCAIMHGAD
jgi:hypothetical protein